MRTTLALALAATTVATSGIALAGPAHAAAQPVPAFVFTSDADGDAEIYLRRTDGQIVQLTRNSVDDHGGSWSPDGRRLVFVSDRDGDAELYTMNADGSGVRQLTRNTRTRTGTPVHEQAPAWSPTGRHIAFVSNRDGGEYKIYRMDADGSRQVRLTSGPAYVTDHTPAWSPDGRHLVFTSDRAGYDNVELFRMRSNGKEVVRLTRTPAGVDDNAPQYSPDGRSIAFSSTRGGTNHDVWTIAANGSTPRKVGGHEKLDDVFPRWSPDGRSLLFSTFAGPEGRPSQDVWAVDLDGSDRRQVLHGSGNEIEPVPQPLTHDPRR